jgi:hypothetical protein
LPAITTTDTENTEATQRRSFGNFVRTTNTAFERPAN